ncbi:MAG: hypothetical protein JXB26_01975 [Candidatus Aminicenantes bacterium]|nr:hypothetical protein [Candidatus Aminicenantes bacterium]
MLHNKKSYLFVLALTCFLIVPQFLSAQTSPEDFLKFKVGADKKLADYSQIRAYFQQLGNETPLLTVFDIGQSVRGKTMTMAVITSEENMARLDDLKKVTKKLRDARGISEEEAQRLALEGKIFVLITCNLHATEIASSQMALELAYDLVTGKTPFDAAKVLEDVVVLLVPTSNPDGETMVTEWYRKYVGTKFEGGRMPWLYHDYAGHDNNRDWFMFNLPETRAITRVLYHDWIPQIHIDEHQMGSTGARLFVPPFMDPPIPNVHPLIWRSVNLCGANMSYALQANGFKGVVHDRSFTGWWIGACDDTSWLHNCTGLLSEMASANIASPIFIESIEIPDSYVEKRMNFPDPWLGGWWRLRDIVEYELCLSKSLIETAYLNKEKFLFNFYRMNKDGIEKAQKDDPYAFVISAEQRDVPTTYRMLDILKFGGVELKQAKKEFVADGKIYPAGSLVVLMAQPYRPYARTLLEKQKYPDIRQYPGGPPVPPYDNAAWTLPLQMGVSCERIEHPFKAELTPLDEVKPSKISSIPETASYLVLDSKTNVSYSAAISLLQKKVDISRSRQGINGKDFHACTGSFIMKNSPAVRETLSPFVEKHFLPVYTLESVEDIPNDKVLPLRIGLYRSWRSNMDEGWTRYVLDDLKIPYTTLRNKDFKGTKKEKADLKSSFDVIIFASENADIIKLGKPGSSSAYRRYFSPMPQEYEGGIGKEGIEALKSFVEKGGILVTLNDACDLIFEEFSPPARNSLERVSRDKFFCPTSILNVEVDPSTPIGYGLPRNTAVMFSSSLAMSTSIPSPQWNRKVVASFPQEDILLSGWLLGEEYLSRKAAVVDLSYEQGHIILIGIRCQWRAQSHGAYKFLLNALLYPEKDKE